MADKKLEDKTSSVFYHDWIYTLDLLPEEEAGRLLLYLLRFAKDRTKHEFGKEEKHLALLYANYCRIIENDFKKWAESCGQKSENAKKRWEKEREQHDDAEGVP